MNKITLKKTYDAYNFIKNIERISKIKYWGIRGINRLTLSSVLNSNGKPYWNYFDE